MNTHAPSSCPSTLRRRLALVLTVLVATVAIVPLRVPASAAEPAQATVAEQREQIEDDLEEATLEERRLAGELAAASAERDRLQELLSDVARQAAEAVDALEAADDLLGRANAELSAAQARLEATERALAEAVEELQDQAVESFIVGGHDEPISVFMAADDMRQLGAAATYRDVVLEYQDTIVERVERLKVARVRDEAAAELAKDAAASAVSAANLRRATVESERSELQVLEAANAVAVLTHTTLLNDVQALKTRYEMELAALVQVSDSLAAALAARQFGQIANPAARGLLALPIPAARLSSSFGPRIHPIFGTARLHAGMDLAAPSGTPIGAAGLGTVVTAGVLGGYGNAVVIDHGGGLSTLYAHQSALNVTVGQVVVPSQVIGLVGSTGNSTGPHLHFEVRVFGTPVDPISFL